jgi:ATP-binding cassette subfamily B multidrug efflux pump
VSVQQVQPTISLGATWRLLAPLLTPRRGILLRAALCILLARIIELAPALILRQAIDSHLIAGRPDGLLVLGVLYLTAVIVAQIVHAGAITLTADAAQGVLRDLRIRLMAHLQSLPISYFDQTPLGDLISRCTADVETIETLFSSGVISLVGNLTRLVTVVGAMLLLSLPLTLVAVGVIVPVSLISRFFQVRVRRAERANRAAVGLLNTHLQELFGGVEVIQTYARVGAFVTRVRRALQATLDASNRTTAYSAFFPPTMVMLATVAIAVLIGSTAAGFVANLGVSIGVLTAFVVLFGQFFEPIAALGDDWQTVQSALTGIERISQVLALRPEHIVAESGSSQSQKTVHSNRATPEPRPLEITQLTFGYRPERAVVRGMSLCLEPGEQVALVGRTGAGKSSIVHLIAGLYRPWTGKIHVAGHDPHRLTSNQRRQLIGVVPQTVQLFSGTIWENLTLGDPTVTREQLERAVVLAGVTDLIAGFPQGYSTPLRGSGRGAGVQLSTGQRQLLALARALVWDPALLLLDEAIVAVDSANDAALWAALRAERHAQRRAVLTVAHRLTTARAADRVVVLEAGQVIEEGRPDDLIRRGGRFAALVELEQAGWNWQQA